MRILFVAPYPPGLTRPRSRNLLRQIRSHGHQVTVVALSIPRLQGDDVVDPRDQEATTLVRRTRARAYASALWGAARSTPLEVAFSASDRWNRVVLESAERSGSELLHVEHIRAASAGFAVDLPKVWDAVDSRTQVWQRAATGGTAATRLLARIEVPRTRRFEAATAARYDSVLVSSTQDRQCFLELNGALDPAVIPNGVDLQYFGQFEWAPEPWNVVMSGVMNYAPNVEAAVRFCRETWPAIRSRCPQAHLWLAGSSPARAVRGLAGPSVTVTGYVEDLRPFLARSGVAICPTRLGAGTQNKILEAMAAGVPVVASYSAATALGMSSGDQLLVADDPGPMADAVLEVLSNRSLAQRLREAALEDLGRRFTWDRVGDALEEVHQTVAGGA